VQSPDRARNHLPSAYPQGLVPIRCGSGISSWCIRCHNRASLTVANAPWTALLYRDCASPAQTCLGIQSKYDECQTKPDIINHKLCVPWPPSNSGVLTNISLLCGRLVESPMYISQAANLPVGVPFTVDHKGSLLT
jgi:hypothetical protein